MNRLMPHTGSKSSRKHIIDVIFPIAVFFVFAASSLAVLMLASKIYDDTSTSASDNYSSRTAFAYVSEKLRQHDSRSGGGGLLRRYGGQRLPDFRGKRKRHRYIHLYVRRQPQGAPRPQRRPGLPGIRT